MLTENVPLQFLVAGERLTAVLAADPAPPPDHLSQLALLEVEAAVDLQDVAAEDGVLAGDEELVAEAAAHLPERGRQPEALQHHLVLRHVVDGLDMPPGLVERLEPHPAMFAGRADEQLLEEVLSVRNFGTLHATIS